MIARLSGTLAGADGGALVLDVSGVGYLVSAPASVMAALPDIGAPLTLHTHLIVREDELSLYGFPDTVSLRAFKVLIGVTGVGPRVALAILSTLSVAALAAALASGDTHEVSRAPGVGARLAQRLCLELGDKLGELALEARAEMPAGAAPSGSDRAAAGDVVEALVGLGYSRGDARRAADRAAKSSPGSTASAMLREALAFLNSL